MGEYFQNFTNYYLVFESDEGYVPLHLRGIVYIVGYHFTSRIIQPDGSVWYHDGQKGHLCEKEGYLKSIGDKNLRTRGMEKLVLAVYAQA